jgi:5-methylcytosine-specific restriction endonuclease McrA
MGKVASPVIRSVCATPGCAEPPINGARCETHAIPFKREANRIKDRSANRKGHALYRTKRWRMTRRRILFDQPLCKCGAIATDVDHIRPLPQANPYDPANLQPLCKTCHGRKTRREQMATG